MDIMDPSWILAITFLTSTILMYVKSTKSQKKTLNDSKLYHAIMKASPDGITICDMRGRILDVSDSGAKMFGVSREKDIGTFVTDYVLPEDKPKAIALSTERLQGNSTGEMLQFRCVRPNGEIFHIELNSERILDSKEQPIGGMIIYRDITERIKKDEEIAEINTQLASLCITDSLTGIPNRRCFEERMSNEYSRHIRLGKELTIIVVDIDHFKAYNDSYGYVKGDACICQVAKVLNDSIFRSDDFVARYSGEEFIFILPNTSAKGASLVTERIRQEIVNLAIPHETSPTAPVVTASFGIASIFCTTDNSISDIIAEAHKMLQQAKSKGRNQVVGNFGENNTKLVPLEWNDSYLSGKSLIDEQHKNLFRLINNLLEMITTPTKIDSCIDNLLNGVTRHFHDEESILHVVNYPDKDKHAKEHEKLLRITKYLIQQYRAKFLTINSLFLFFAYELVEQHMLSSDKYFFQYLKSK